MKFIKVKTYEEMSRKAANIMSAQIIIKPDSVIGLATGSTPIGLYTQLAEWYKKGDIDFSKVKSVNLDEYVGLSADNEQSYRHFMNVNFFDKINIDKANTFLPDGNAADLEAECKKYDQRIKDLGDIDMQLLGIGHDGHIGFNEPNVIFEKDTNVVELTDMTIDANSRFFKNRDEVPRRAITMGAISIMHAKRILLVANGPDKKEIVEKAFFGPITPQIPASILQLHSDITVIYSEN